MRYFALLFFLFSSLLVPPPEGRAQMIAWEQTNGPFGGDGLCLAVDSIDWVLLGTTKGVYGLPAVGGYWTSLGLEQYSVQSIAVHNSGAILAASSAGMFTTTDHGSTWGVSDLTVSVSLVVSSLDGFVYAAGSGGEIYRSDDIGVHWAEVRNGQHVALAVNSEGDLFALDYLEIARSTDHGDTWESLSIDAPGLGSSLCVLPDRGLFVGTFNFSCPDPPEPCEYGGMFLMSDWGDSLISVLLYQNVFDLFSNSSRDIFVISDEGSLLLFNSDDSTITTFPIYQVNTALDLGDGIFVAGRTGLGTFASFDAGSNWFESNGGLKNSTVTNLFAIDSMTILAGSFPRLFRSTNRGDSWNPVLEVVGYGQCYMIAATNGSLFASVGSTGLYQSINGGQSWTWKGFNAGGTDWLQAFVYSFIKANGDSLLVGATRWGKHGMVERGVFLSENNGDTWEKIGMDGMTPRSLALDSTGVLIAGTWANGIYRSTDNGSSWIYSGAGSASIASLLVTHENLVFAGTDGSGVFRSTDGGAVWTAVNQGLNSLRISSLNKNAEGEILAGSYDEGVFVSTDAGLSWSQEALGLTSEGVLALAIAEGGYAYAGTDGHSVFRTTGSTTDVGEGQPLIPTSAQLLQNYPNPFNGISNFEFSIANLGDVTLKIYDLLGRVVATIVDERLGPGVYTRQWDATGMASGVYVYRIEAAGFLQTRKLVLVR